MFGQFKKAYLSETNRDYTFYHTIVYRKTHGLEVGCYVLLILKGC